MCTKKHSIAPSLDTHGRTINHTVPCADCDTSTWRDWLSRAPGSYIRAFETGTYTFSTLGYAKDSYVRRALDREAKAWERFGVPVHLRPSVNRRDWVSRDWYNRSFGDYSYEAEVWIQPHGPISAWALPDDAPLDTYMLWAYGETK